jgi:predicted DNA-binding transcriptional regulator YafY
MRRADRLFQIVQFLRGGRLVRAADLAERLEVSERTIYRDMADLQSTGVPIEGEAGVGYVMQGGYDLPPMMFTHDEVVALVAGARLLRAWGGAAMAAAAEEALVKIADVLPEAERSRAASVQVHSIAANMNDELRAMIDRLEGAVDRRAILILGYTDGKDHVSTRRIQPLGLWFWGRVWTLVAWCELREDFRMFRLDRIQTAVDTGEKFRPVRSRSLTAFYEQGAYVGYDVGTPSCG